MATKQQVLGKIADLLKDINSQFDDLEKDSVAGDSLKADLFEATVSYFAANVAVYNKLQKIETEASAHPAGESDKPEEPDESTELDELDNSDTGTDDSEEIAFTPSSAESSFEASTDVLETDMPTGTDIPNGNHDEEQVDDDEELTGTDDHGGAAEVKMEPGESTNEDSIPDQGDDDTLAWETGLAENEEEGIAVKKSNEETPVSNEHPQEPSAEVDSDNEKTVGADEGTDHPVSEEVVISEKAVEVEAAHTSLPSAGDDDEKSTRALSLNERLSAQRKAGGSINPLAAAKNEGDRISDIKSAISLNDKLLFIKDLFNGYSLAYSEAIELLNRYDDFAAADGFLQTNYAQKNNWADKPETVDKLYAILRKRFG